MVMPPSHVVGVCLRYVSDLLNTAKTAGVPADSLYLQFYFALGYAFGDDCPALSLAFKPIIIISFGILF